MEDNNDSGSIINNSSAMNHDSSKSSSTGRGLIIGATSNENDNEVDINNIMTNDVPDGSATATTTSSSALVGGTRTNNDNDGNYNYPMQFSNETNSNIMPQSPPQSQEATTVTNTNTTFESYYMESAFDDAIVEDDVHGDVDTTTNNTNNDNDNGGATTKTTTEDEKIIGTAADAAAAATKTTENDNQKMMIGMGNSNSNAATANNTVAEANLSSLAIMPNSTNNDSIGADSMIREQPSEAMMGNANDNDDDIGKAKDDDGDDSDATEEYKSTMFAEDEDEDDALLQPPPAHAHARAQQMEQPQPQSTEQQDETNQQDKDDKLGAIEIASWGSNDSDVIEIIEPPSGNSSNNGGNTLPNSPPSSSAASASFQSRSQNMPQWMANNNNSTTTSSNNAPKNESGMLPVSHNNYNPSIPGTANSSNSNAYTTTHGYGNSSNINHGNPYHSTSSYNNNSNPYYASSSSTSYQGIQQPHQPLPSYIQIPTSHTPTWSNILPKDYYSSQQGHHNNQYQYNSYGSSASQRKKLSLSLINMWEFTITIESLDYGYGGYNNRHEVIQGLRSNIKKIAREHVGREGRKGAIFERGSLGEGIVPDDPLLKQVTNSEGDADNSSQPTGRWRIPLGAYQQLMTYLISDRNNVVEGIPPEQLRAATLGRERQSKKEYAKVDELLKRLVSPSVCHALAPYQRGGVEFMLDKEGRALLADEMGLGKTVQAIAAMSAFQSDWPLLVLCPSTARYHWEVEFRCWLGTESKHFLEAAKVAAEGGGDSTEQPSAPAAPILQNSQINVLTSGKDAILKYDGSTRVVICSMGLIVNLATSNRIYPGMFRAIIVDESHALKSKSSKRTKVVTPLLKAAERCLLLSGTPAFARPSELWPQLSVLGTRPQLQMDVNGMMVNVNDNNNDGSSGIWCNEDEFMSKYVKGKGAEGGIKTRLAELHTMLTSTVMIRRMKADILKNLPAKIREKAYINIEDEGLKNEFRTYMQLLRQGKGVLGKLARQHHSENPTSASQGVVEPYVQAGDDGVLKSKEVLHHLYNISGRSKISRVTKMLKSWLADPTKGKLCIFAHHLDVLNQIGKGAGLSNLSDSTTKYIRIDGSTNPKARQAQILQFQTDPAVRIAMLGITAAGVAVTLTAASTVWFVELFWTPAIMIQAEDRCHRIGQQARVRCLYFIAKGTLDEVLWKLIEKKFRDLGEFVEGKENMGIALERTLEDGEDEEILKSEDNGDGSRKRKAEDVFSELLDSEDLRDEIDELVHEEEDMLKIKNDEDDDEPDTEEKGTESDQKMASTSNKGAQRPTATKAEDMAIELSSDEEETGPTTIAQIRNLYKESGILAKLKIDNHVRFKNLRAYTLQYPGPTYGLIMVSCNGRVVVKCHHGSDDSTKMPKIGTIIIGCNGYILPHNAPFAKVLQLMKHFMQTPPVSVIFAEDDDFTTMFVEDFLPHLPVRKMPTTIPSTASHSSSSAAAATSRTAARRSPNPTKKNEVVELLDSDED